MKPQRVKCIDEVEANRGRVALRYGPLVYNIEAVDGNNMDGVLASRFRADDRVAARSAGRRGGHQGQVRRRLAAGGDPELRSQQPHPAARARKSRSRRRRPPPRREPGGTIRGVDSGSVRRRSPACGLAANASYSATHDDFHPRSISARRASCPRRGRQPRAGISKWPRRWPRREHRSASQHAIRIATQVRESSSLVNTAANAPPRPATSRTPNRLRNTVAAVEAKFGKLDILINSAGINVRGAIDAVSPDDFDKVQRVNVTGTWLMCRQAVPLMKRQRYGRIVNIGSMLSIVGMSRAHAVRGQQGRSPAAHPRARDRAGSSGITVNAILPGPFATEMNLPLTNDPEKYKAFVARIPAGTLGRAARDRRPGAVPGQPRVELRHGCRILDRRRLERSIDRVLVVADCSPAHRMSSRRNCDLRTCSPLIVVARGRASSACAYSWSDPFPVAASRWHTVSLASIAAIGVGQ